MEEFLVHLVVVLVAKNYNNYLWVPEDAIRTTHHVVEELLPEFRFVAFTFQLNEGRLFNSHFQLPTGLHNVIVDSVGNLELRATLA